MRQDGWRRLWRGTLLALLLAAPIDALAQDAEADDAAAPETLVVEDEVRALVAPVALYPDPLLAVVLQAAMFPVDVVQADRFIQSYQEDQTLEPSADWDPAVTALLGYPSVLAEMNEHLDWTEAMGDAVYDQLEDVQDSIQDLRQGAYTMGVLESNEVQDVVVTDGIIEIRPTSPDQVSIPQYDGFALLGSLETVSDAAADETADETAAADAAAAEEPAGADEAEVAGEAETEVVEEEVPAETAAEEEAPVETAEAEAGTEGEYVDESGYAEADPYASSYAAPVDPTYAQAPVYAAAPPPVAYSQPTSSAWGSTATFLGGAAIGGLLGYAIFDDDDDHDHNNGGNNNRRNDINIEDSTIVLGGDGDRLDLDRDQKNRVNAELRERRDRSDQGARRERDRNRQVAALPGGNSAGRQREQRRDVSLPQRDRDRPAKVERRQPRDTKAVKAPKQKKGGVADIKRPSQTKKDAQRGKQSRQKATARSGGSRPQAAQSRGGGKRQAMSPKRGGKKQAQGKSNRGKKSRGGRRGRG